MAIQSDKPCLSIIVTSYNNALYLDQCLESILSQSFQDMEIIVIDDASSDGSIDLIREKEAQYPNKIRGLFRTTNGGPGLARHQAIEYAVGDYITTLDGDDFYYNPRKLESEMAVIRQSEKQKNVASIAFSDIALVDPGGTLINQVGDIQPIREGNLFNEIISRNCMIPRDFIVRRHDYLSVGGYRYDLRTFEDWDLKLRLAARCHFIYSRQVGTAYRIGGRGLSSKDFLSQTRCLWNVFISNYSMVPVSDRESIRKKFYHYMEKWNKEIIHKDRDLNTLINRFRLSLFYLKAHIALKSIT